MINEAINSGESIESRYEKAQNLARGVLSKTVAFNTTLYPIWIGQSDFFWYERESSEGREYRLVDAAEAVNNEAFNHQHFASTLGQVLAREIDPYNLPITEVDMDLDVEKSIIQSLDFTAFGKRFSFHLVSGVCQEKGAISKSWSISPDGKKAAFVRDCNLWLRDTVSGKERALTDDGEDEFVYGIAGSAWGHLMGSEAQACWSDDSKRIFTVQRDTRLVKNLPVIHHVPRDGSLRPILKNYKIAYPGDEHTETLRLVCIEVETGKQQQANYPQIPVTRNSFGFFTSKLGWWSTDNRCAYFVDMERDYRAVRVMEFDTDTGDTRTLFEETSETHINLMLNQDELPTFMPMPETNELLWFSERSGWAHLYLYDLETGKLKNSVTQGDWLIRHVVKVDIERREVFVQTAGRYPNRDPYYRDLCRVNLDTGDLTELVSGDYEVHVIMQTEMNTASLVMNVNADIANACGVSSRGNFAVVTKSRADTIPTSFLIDRDGNHVLELEVADVSGLPAGWHWPEPVKLLAADGETDIYGLVYRPSDFSKENSYPIISHVFNTPELPWVPKGSFTNGSFAFGWPYLDAAALAELGFIVVQIDGRGTPFRNKSFCDESYGWLESVSNLDDHVAGIKQLAERYSCLDLERVGITTHNTGGSGGIQGLLQHPDFYKVSVNMIPHDSRLMPASMWGEKYEGLDGPKTDGLYPEMLVDKLQGKLLLIGGMLDTTCPPTIIFRLVEALQKANKDFDLLLMPNLGHTPSSYAVRRSWDYLVRNLLNFEPPRDFKLTTFADG